MARLAIGALVGLLLVEGLLRLAAPVLPVPLRALVRVEFRRHAVDAMRRAGGTRIVLDRDAVERGDYDVVVIGDSFVYGSLVSEEEAFPGLLAQRAGRPVLNLGAASQGPTMYTALTRFYLDATGRPPEHLVYVLFGNDFRQKPRERSNPRGAFLWREEYDSDAGLQMRRFREWSLQHVLSFQMLRLLVRPEARRPATTPVSNAVYEGDGLSLVLVGREYWEPRLAPDNGRFDVGLATALKHVRQAREACDEHGVRLSVVLMPFKEQVYGPSLVGSGAVDDTFYAEWYDSQYDRILAALSEQGDAALDLRPGLRAAAARGEQLFFTVDGHLSPRGHEVVAEALLDPLGLR